MKPRSALAALALFFAVSLDAQPAYQPLPSCWPGLKSATYQGTDVEIGEGTAHRWARWMCFPVDAASGLPVKAPYIIGVKSIPLTTLFGRMQNIENSTSRAITYSLMWKAYVLLDPTTDPQLTAGVTQMKATPW